VLHEVTLTNEFMILSTEVTREDFMSLMGYTNDYKYLGCGDDCPIGNLMWSEAAAYCNVLSGNEGLDSCYECRGSGEYVRCEASELFSSPYMCPGYRLPTEAEWEYAARGGTASATYNGEIEDPGCESEVLDPIAWYCGNSEVTYDDSLDCSSWGGPSMCGLQPVATRRPNAWGLYDMLGNQEELCHDWYEEYLSGDPAVDPWGPELPNESERWGHVKRSAYFTSRAAFHRAAIRNHFYDDTEVRSMRTGFRPARTVSP
jgi:formylglycine-generating enzyme required for sulfatase activity